NAWTLSLSRAPGSTTAGTSAPLAGYGTHASRSACSARRLGVPSPLAGEGTPKQRTEPDQTQAVATSSPLDRTAQVERRGIFHRALLRRHAEEARGVAVGLEAREAARFGFVGINRKCLVVAPAGMRHVIDAAAERATVPAVDDVEGERRVHVDGRMQRRGKLPCLEGEAGEVFAASPGWRQRNAAAVARYNVPRGVEPLEPDL